MKATKSKTPAYIIDSSAIISHFLPDEKTPSSLSTILDQFLQNKAALTAPSLLRYEFGNNLRSSVLRNRLDPTSSIKIADLFLKLNINYHELNTPETLKLALKHNLSFYDASYIYLSHALKLPLLSLDNHLTKLSQSS